MCRVELHGDPELRIRSPQTGKRATVCYGCYDPKEDETVRVWTNDTGLSNEELLGRLYWRWLYFAVGRNDSDGQAKMANIREMFGGEPYRGLTVPAGKQGRHSRHGYTQFKEPTVDEALEYLVRTGGVYGITTWRGLLDWIYRRAVADGFKHWNLDKPRKAGRTSVHPVRERAA